MHIHLFFRKPTSGFFSIENVFQTVLPSLKKATIKVDVLYMPKSGAGLATIFHNLIFTCKRKAKLNHITGDIHYIALVTGRNTVLTIHDIGSALEGAFLKKWYIRLFWFYIPVFFVKHVTVISEFTKKQLIQLIPFAKNKVSVVPNAIHSDFVYTSKKFNETCPSILCVGTKKNKNLPNIIESLKDINCHLFIIGKLNANQIKSLENHQINYTNKSDLTNEEVVQAYQNCDILCFPSTYEGFGMPIIEAQATGRPVLTSSFGAMREIAKDSACLVDPYNVDSIKQGLVKIIFDKKYREDLIERGLKNANRFQIDTVANQYLSIYKSMM